MEPFVCSEEVKCKSLSGIRVSATPWTGARQALLSMGFSRQEYRRGLLFPSLELAFLGGSYFCFDSY